MTQDKGNTGGGVGAFFLLFLTFMVLKLCNVIDWSWWLVTGPLWMPFTLLFTVLLLAMMAGGNKNGRAKTNR